MAELARAFNDFFWGAAQDIQGSINANLPKLVERVPALGAIVPGGGAGAPELASEIDTKKQLAITSTDDVARATPQGAESSESASHQEPAKDKGD